MSGKKNSSKNNTQKASVNKDVKNNEKNKTNIQTDVKADATTEPEIRLNFYTSTALIAILVSAINTILAFIFTAKPDYFYVVSKFGSSDDDNLDTYLELYREMIFGDKYADGIFNRSYILAALAAITTIIFIVVVTRITNPTKKPAVLMTVIACIFSVATLIVCIITRNYAVDCFVTAKKTFEFMGAHAFGIYECVFIGCITNVATAFMAVVGSFVATKKYKKDGIAF